MPNFIDLIKQKYLEEVGWSFNFFEGISFYLYLAASYEILCNSNTSMWKFILKKSAYDLIVGNASILKNARVIDYIISAIFTAATVYSFRYLARKIYDFLATLQDMDGYVERLKIKYAKTNFNGQAMRIYIANEAKDQKQVYMKQMTVMNGFGLIAFGVMVISLLGLLTPNLADFIVTVVSACIFLFIQWQVFSRYTSQVVPRLVLERTARGDDVQFGDEYEK